MEDFILGEQEAECNEDRHRAVLYEAAAISIHRDISAVEAIKQAEILMLRRDEAERLNHVTKDSNNAIVDYHEAELQPVQVSNDERIKVQEIFLRFCKDEDVTPFPVQ
jgi:hypothetical protein